MRRQLAVHGGPVHARLYEYSGHTYLVLADPVDVVEMLPLTSGAAGRVREALRSPHPADGPCRLELVERTGELALTVLDLASSADARALALALLTGDAHAEGARILDPAGAQLAWVPQRG